MIRKTEKDTRRDMNRRTFLREAGMTAAGLACCSPVLGKPSGGVPQVRKSKNWAWIGSDAEASDDYWKARFEKLKEARFDAVLPEVYNGRASHFRSDRFGTRAGWLERLIPIARSFGLEIHAWMWTVPCLLEDVLRKHPDWYMVNRLGESSADQPAYVDYYRFLCPSREEVREFIRETVREISRFDVDGVHLDYVRYPDVILAKGLWPKYNVIQDREYPRFDYCYCGTCRTKFREQHGIDPMDIEEPSVNREWLQFRYDQVTGLVNNWLIPAGRQHGKIMSAAVFPNWRHVRQEWRAWNLDAVLPMLYNRYYLEGAAWIADQCREGIRSLQHSTQLYSGLMLDRPETLKEYAMKSFEGGAAGISIFSLRRLTDEHLTKLAEVIKNH